MSSPRPTVVPAISTSPPGPRRSSNAGATGGTLTGDRSVFAFRTDANVALGGFTLNVGDVWTPGNGAGIILNNGADPRRNGRFEDQHRQATLYLYVDDAAVSALGVPVTNVRNNATTTSVPRGSSSAPAPSTSACADDSRATSS